MDENINFKELDIELEDQLYQIHENYCEDDLDLDEVVEILYEHMQVVCSDDLNIHITDRSLMNIVSKYANEHYDEYAWV